MSELITENQKCVICGHINKIDIWAGFMTENGENSLDSRPGGMARYHFYEHLKICENCHYVNTSLNKLIPSLNKKIIKSQEYQQFFDDGIDHTTIFVAGSYLFRSVNDHLNAGYCMLACAWLFEDNADEKYLADSFRNIAKSELEQYISSNPDDYYSLILVDVYRRTQDFDKAYDLAVKLLKRKILRIV